jgi:uncharacterized protein with HEPN domain
MLKKRLSGMKSNKIFLNHILDEIKFLMESTEGMKFEEFIEDETLKRASSRSIEIIGEAVKNLSGDFRRSYKNIEWKKIAGLRDKVIHYYFGVNWDIVWDVIKNRVPELKVKIESILQEMSEK